MSARTDFLDHLTTMVGYWGRVAKTPEEAASGMAFSVLVALDGEAAVGPFAVRPIAEDGTEGEDIIGGAMLHDKWCRRNA